MCHGTSLVRSDSSMVSNGAELKAFLTSNVSIATIHRGPTLRPTLTLFMTSDILSSVNLPHLNPYWLAVSSCRSSIISLQRTFISFLNSMPMATNMHNGFYELGSSKGLSCFRSNTSLPHFHAAGNLPCVTHRLNTPATC